MQRIVFTAGAPHARMINRTLITQVTPRTTTCSLLTCPEETLKFLAAILSFLSDASFSFVPSFVTTLEVHQHCPHPPRIHRPFRTLNASESVPDIGGVPWYFKRRLSGHCYSDEEGASVKLFSLDKDVSCVGDFNGVW